MSAIRTAAVAALALALGLTLGAGEAAAQTRPGCPTASINAAAIVFEDDPVRSASVTAEEFRALFRAFPQIQHSPRKAIYCRYGHADGNDRAIVVHNPEIDVFDDFTSGVEAWHEGVGHLDVYVHAVDGRPGRAGRAAHPDPLDARSGIWTAGNAADYLTGEESHGVSVRHDGEGRLGLDVRDVSIRTVGDYAHGVRAWQKGSWIFREALGDSTRARGAVVVNLVESDRGRAARVRPLVGTRGDYADAVRAEYTRGAASGHVVVTVKGYTIATGGVVPLGAVALPQSRDRTPFDPTRPYYRNPNHDPGDPDSREFLNLHVYGLSPFPGWAGAPHDVVRVPVRNPAWDPDDMTPCSATYMNSCEFVPGGAAYVWDGGYFRPISETVARAFASCRARTDAAERAACFEAVDDGGGGPTGFRARGVHANHEGLGDIRIRIVDSAILTRGADAHGVHATHSGRTIETPAADPGDPPVVMRGGGAIDIEATGGAVRTAGAEAHGVYARHQGSGALAIALKDVSIATAGETSHGVLGWIRPNSDLRPADRAKTGVGDVAIDVSGGSIATSGRASYAVWASHDGEGDVGVTVAGGAATAGREAHAVVGDHRSGAGDLAVTVGVGGRVTTRGDGAYGVFASLGVRTGVETPVSGPAFQVLSTEYGGSGDLTVRVAGGAVATEGEGSTGVLALHGGAGALVVAMTGGSVEAKGDYAYGVHAARVAAGDISIDVSGGSVVAEGVGGVGVLARGSGDIAVTVGEGASVAGGHVGIQLSVVEGDAPTSSSRGRSLARSTAAQDAGAPAYTVRVAGTVTTRMARADLTATTIPGSGVYLPAGGQVIVSANGLVSAASGRAVVARSGDLVVVLVDSDGLSGVQAPPRIEGRIEETGGEPQVLLQPSGSTERVELAVGDAPTLSGAWDVSLTRDGDGAISVARVYAPRARVYEALPSVLLGLGGLPEFRERTAAARSENGGWVLFDVARGGWKAAASTTPTLGYDHSRYGVTTGLDVPLGEGDRRLGVSLHRRQGSADVDNGGKIDLTGFGLGLSGSWSRDGIYADVQAETTWWDADLASSTRGNLKGGASARGHALALEAGRRVGTFRGAALTPRARLTYSRASMEAFTDAGGARVSLEDADSLRGGAGVTAEAPDGRMFGSLDVERELSADARVLVSGTELRSEADATWLRLGLGGVHSWDDGRYTLQGAVNWATSGDSNEIGGQARLSVRF